MDVCVGVSVCVGVCVWVVYFVCGWFVFGCVLCGWEGLLCVWAYVCVGMGGYLLCVGECGFGCMDVCVASEFV